MAGVELEERYFYIAGVMKVTNMIWVIFSRFATGFNGASVKKHILLLRKSQQNQRSSAL